MSSKKLVMNEREEKMRESVEKINVQIANLQKDKPDLNKITMIRMLEENKQNIIHKINTQEKQQTDKISTFTVKIKPSFSQQLPQIFFSLIHN